MSRLTSVDPRPSATAATLVRWASSVPIVATLRRELLKELLSSYRPELHYMRGPGPKCRAKVLNANTKCSDRGDPLMTIQSDHNHHPTGRVTLFAAATIVLFVFASTYVH